MGIRNSAWSFLWGEYNRLDPFGVRAAHPVAGVEERDVEHEPDEEHRETGLDVVEEFGAHGAAADEFEQRQQDMPAIEDRQRQQVEHGEVHVEDDTEPQDASPAFFVLQ